MTLAQLITELQKYENQDATMHIVYGTDDDDIFDRTDFELFSDTSTSGYVDIFVHEEGTA